MDCSVFSRLVEMYKSIVVFLLTSGKAILIPVFVDSYISATLKLLEKLHKVTNSVRSKHSANIALWVTHSVWCKHAANVACSLVIDTWKVSGSSPGVATVRCAQLLGP